MSPYRVAAVRVPDWRPPLWLRTQIFIRNFDRPVGHSGVRCVAFALAVVVCTPVIVAWRLAGLGLRIVLGIVLLLFAGVASLLTSRPVYLEIDWK